MLLKCSKYLSLSRNTKAKRNPRVHHENLESVRILDVQLMMLMIFTTRIQLIRTITRKGRFGGSMSDVAKFPSSRLPTATAESLDSRAAAAPFCGHLPSCCCTPLRPFPGPPLAFIRATSSFPFQRLFLCLILCLLSLGYIQVAEVPRTTAIGESFIPR